MLRMLPGQTENIRLTVAFAESYVLIVDFLPNRFTSAGRNTVDHTADAEFRMGCFFIRKLQYMVLEYEKEIFTMRTTSIFRGVATALITPLTENGIDFDAY